MKFYLNVSKIYTKQYRKLPISKIFLAFFKVALYFSEICIRKYFKSYIISTILKFLKLFQISFNSNKIFVKSLKLSTKLRYNFSEIYRKRITFLIKFFKID